MSLTATSSASTPPRSPTGYLAPLAADVRALDMRASPYDLANLGYPPVPIETPTGRAEYARRQVAFAQRAAPPRELLVAVCDSILC